MLQLVSLILAYLLGGIPSGLLIARAFGIADIRKFGSGNIGATNVWRAAGGKAAFWVYLADISKGMVAVYLGHIFFGLAPGGWFSYDTLLVSCAVAAIIGNVFPIYLHFRGGKGVNTALGGVLTMLPVETLISFIAFVIVVFLSRYISAGSIVGAIMLALIVIFERFIYGMPVADVYVYLTIILALLILFTHRKNIGRIIEGTESRFSFSSKKAGQNA